ncbi:hypothetical protein HMI55_006542 [Coelomomyces lativittatus]|nr:hypothetical protein HMI55_006542 [Coelomomyces lativittatus]
MIKNPTIIPDAITTRWIAYTTSFDFDLQHIDQEKNALPDSLTRRGECESNTEDESDIEEYLDQIVDDDPLHVNSLFECVEVPVPKVKYSKDHQAILIYLKTRQLPKDSTADWRKWIRRNSMKYLVQDQVLWWKNGGSMPCKVVDDHRT